MAVNYEDERFKEVESDKNQALTELEQTYGGMIDESKQYYNAQIEASKQWADTQTQLQQEQTDFAIEQIEQQKEQAKKDYTKEQSGAYVDWQKESNRYNANAEQMAAQGLTNTGYGESSQVRMYNAYQSRVSSARESYNQAVLNYNNAIKDAQLQNNSILAEIAYEALQKQLELSLQGFQYENQLVLEKANKKTELEQIYHSRYQDVLEQINTENALAEQIRQYNQNYELELKKQNEEIRQFNEEIERLKAKDAQDHALEIQQLEYQKALAQAQLEEEQRQFNAQLAEEQRQYDGKLNSGSGEKPVISKTPESSGNEPNVFSAYTNIDNISGYQSAQNNDKIFSAYQGKAELNSQKETVESIAALGYGALRPGELADLVNQGKVVEYEENGVTKFKNNSGVKQRYSTKSAIANAMNKLLK